MKKIITVTCVALLACFCLTSCQYWQDEDGKMHFMLVGERGPTKDGKSIAEEDLTASPEEELMTLEENTNSEMNPTVDTIKGDSLKKGWTDNDHSILKGTNVSITEDSNLFSFTAKKDKNVKVHLNTKLERGDYEIVLILPDKTEAVLYDAASKTNQQKVILKKGLNSIVIRCDDVLFKTINLSIDGLELSDF